MVEITEAEDFELKTATEASVVSSDFSKNWAAEFTKLAHLVETGKMGVMLQLTTNFLYMPQYKAMTVIDEDDPDEPIDIRVNSYEASFPLYVKTQHIGENKFQRFFEVELPGKLAGEADNEAGFDIQTYKKKTYLSEEEVDMVKLSRRLGAANETDLVLEAYKFAKDVKEFAFISLTLQDYGLDAFFAEIEDEEED